MELAPVYDLSAVNQRHFRHFQFLVQRDSRTVRTDTTYNLCSVPNRSLEPAAANPEPPPLHKSTNW